MSKKANPASIGLFIVIGVGLGVSGMLLFSSSRLFSRTREVIVYFDQSLNGLNEGAPVKYRGVTIGSVKRTMVHFNQATNDYSMPVILELQEKLLRRRMGDTVMAFSDETLEDRIKSGLRATLQTESLVTGVLYIDMWLNPDAPTPVFHQLKKRYPEIPTEPTQIQAMFNNLASLDLKGMGTNMHALLVNLNAVLTDLDMAQINAGITNVLHSVDRLAASPEINSNLAVLHTTLEQYRALGEKLNNRLDPLADSLTNSLAEANRSLQELRGAVENLRTMLAPDSPLRNGLELNLQQLASAAQSLAALTEFLNRHPNAIVVGREPPKKP